jgi:hypothetical protein
MGRVTRWRQKAGILFSGGYDISSGNGHIQIHLKNMFLDIQVSGKYVSGHFRLEVEKNKNAFLEGVKKNRVPL